MEQLQNSSSDSVAELSLSKITSSSSSDSVSTISTNASSSSDSELSSSQSSPLISECSVSTISFLSSDCVATVSKVPCFFDPTTCQYQSFSFPEKIVYYLTKNCTNAETFQKLIESCKYFFKVNPVVVVPRLINDNGTWSIYNHEKLCATFTVDQTLHFKIWLNFKLFNLYDDASKLIPKIYRNDATSVHIVTKDQKWEELLIFAAPAEFLYMSNYSIKYENGEIVPFEDIVENLPKIQYLKYSSNVDGSDITLNTFNKLMEIEHFKHISYLSLYGVPEELNVETMFNYILENKHIQIYIRYRSDISDTFKERIREYSNQLDNEDGCKSNIGYQKMYFGDGSVVASISSFDDSISSEDDDSDSFEEDDDEGLLFPWNNEEDEGWELPWDTKE